MISVIIPTYNEEAVISTTIKSLWQYDDGNLIKEIIIADGGSSDETCRMALSEGVKVVVCPKKGRAAQMNYGASLSTQKILYFLHADSAPPYHFSTHILKAVHRGYGAGCFMLQFDHSNLFLKANCWFTRFNVTAFHYGDQSLFVDRGVFEQVNGFSEAHLVFEDYDMIKKLKKKTSFYIIKKAVTTSARKYRENGIFKMQGIFYLMYFLYRSRFSQEKLVSIYKSLTQQNKI